jgi:two-component system response regulator AtoC
MDSLPAAGRPIKAFGNDKIMNLMNILVVDDEKSQLNILNDILSDAGYAVSTASSGERAIKLLGKNNFLIVLTDLKMPGIDGIELLQHTLEINPETQVILMTAFGSIPNAVNAIKNGAYDYLTKPFQKEDLLKVISHAAERAQLLFENRRLKDEMSQRYGYHNIIGASNAMKEVYRLLDRVKDIDATVMISGESGTGKEMIARAIHSSGSRKDKPFVPINCGAIPETLIESELFGHEKGSFTGASRTHIGKFEQARNGTIFLDEIGIMPLASQARLLRVLQEKKIERVGSNDSVNLDVRVIAATNEDLQRKVGEKEFRPDLYHRLNVFAIHLPPLRDRREDIPLLAKYFIKKFCERYGKKEMTLSPTALGKLEQYHFPGNVRELENILEKTIILIDKEVIGEKDLMIFESSSSRIFSGNEADTLPQKELEFIKNALRQSRGSIKQASQKLGISYKTLQYRMKKYRLNKRDFKSK